MVEQVLVTNYYKGTIEPSSRIRNGRIVVIRKAKPGSESGNFSLKKSAGSGPITIIVLLKRSLGPVALRGRNLLFNQRHVIGLLKFNLGNRAPLTCV